MKLRDCTKAELLWVIQRAREHSLGSINGYIDHALSDLRFQRAEDRLKRAEELSKEADQARGKFVELMRPYDGKRYMDIPRNILEAAKAAIQRADKLDREYLKIMREVDKL